MFSRDINDLLPGTRRKWLAAKEEWNSTHPVPAFEVGVYRDQAEQDALWAQSRFDLDTVNRIRERADLPSITEDENKNRVTWTKRSKHTERRAVDFAFKMPKAFDLKADVDMDGVPDFMEFGAICVRHGLQHGIINGDGEHVDLGHVQDNEKYEEVRDG